MRKNDFTQAIDSLDDDALVPERSSGRSGRGPSGRSHAKKSSKKRKPANAPGCGINGRRNRKWSW